MNELSKVVPNFKGPDKDSSESSSYRLIRLLNGLETALEGVILARFNGKMDDRWNNLQYGFRKEMKTDASKNRVKDTTRNCES